MTDISRKEQEAKEKYQERDGVSAHAGSLPDESVHAGNGFKPPQMQERWQPPAQDGIYPAGQSGWNNQQEDGTYRQPQDAYGYGDENRQEEIAQSTKETGTAFYPSPHVYMPGDEKPAAGMAQAGYRSDPQNNNVQWETGNSIQDDPDFYPSRGVSTQKNVSAAGAREDVSVSENRYSSAHRPSGPVTAGSTGAGEKSGKAPDRISVQAEGKDRVSPGRGVDTPGQAQRKIASENSVTASGEEDIESTRTSLSEGGGDVRIVRKDEAESHMRAHKDGGENLHIGRTARDEAGTSGGFEGTSGKDASLYGVSTFGTTGDIKTPSGIHDGGKSRPDSTGLTLAADGRLVNPEIRAPKGTDGKVKTGKDLAKESEKVKVGKAAYVTAHVTAGLKKIDNKLQASVNDTDEDRNNRAGGVISGTYKFAGRKAGEAAAKAGGSAVKKIVTAFPIPTIIISIIVAAVFIIACGLYSAWYPQTSYTYPDGNDEGESIAQEAVDRITNRLYAYEYEAMYGDAGPYEGADGTEKMASLGSLGKGVEIGSVQEIKFSGGKCSKTIKLNEKDSYEGTVTKFVQLCMSMATVEKLNNLVGLYDDLSSKDDVQNFYDYAQHVVTVCLDCSTVKDGIWYINVDIGDVIADESALKHPGWAISFIRLWARSYMVMDDDAWLEMMGVEIPERVEYQFFTDGTGSLSGDLATIANFLKSNFGFSNAQAAAIMGNMWQESRFDVGASNRGMYLGLCQWGGGRKSALLSYAGSTNGGNWKDLNTQLGYLKKELTGSYKKCVSGLKGHSDVDSATKYWLDIFEGAPGQQLAARQAQARKILSQLESGTLDSGSGSMSSSDHIQVAVAIAADNKYIYVWGGGHIVYSGRNHMPSGFDCSGFVSWCLYKAGYPLKSAFSTSNEISVLKSLGFKEVPASQARRGDVLVNPNHTEFCYDPSHEIGAHGIHGQYASTTPKGSAGANYSKGVSGHANSISIKPYNFKANYSNFRCFRPSSYSAKGGAGNGSSGEDVNKVTLNKGSLTLSPSNPSAMLTATVSPQGAKNRAVTWRSSNTKIARVSAGKVTMVSAGTCTITASTKNGKKATCKVQVNGGVTSLTCTSGLTLSVGESGKVSVIAVPSGSYTYSWSSSNRKVAKVGSDGRVYAVGSGTASITVSCGGKKAVCNITVR